MAMPNIKEIDEAIKLALKELDPEELDIKDIDAGDFSYEGFNPRLVIALVQKRAKDCGSDWIADVTVMVNICLLRGNNLGKMTVNMSEIGKKRIAALITNYKLISAKGGKDTLSLSRVALSFSWVTCQVMHNGMQTVVSSSELSSGYPRAMMSPAFGSMIPNKIDENVQAQIIGAYLLHQVTFGRKIKKGKQPYVSASNDAFKYCEMAMQNPILTDSQKVKLLVKWGILVNEKTVTPEVVSAKAEHDARITENKSV